MTSADVVSVVIPCYNEERFILKALNQLVDQYDHDRYEIIVVDGLSSDRTRVLIEDFRRAHPDVLLQLLDNPARNIPTALNLGTNAARGNIIARMDAHAVPGPGYIRRCVEVLKGTDAAVVGMPCRVRPGAETLMARAIASAVSHPFGIGDAKYRLGKAGPLQEAVDTVAFACFGKSLWRDLGGFNERLLTNEDYDFNYRVRQSGRKVILDRTSHCDYFARSTLRGLAAQYRRYGAWKAAMIRINPGSIRLRHLAAPLFVLSLSLLAIVGIAWRPAWWILLAEILIYLGANLLAGAQATIKAKGNPLMIVLTPLAFVAIHLNWGGAFLIGLLRRQPR